MNILIDLVMLLVLLIGVIIGWKSGVVRSFISLVGTVAAAIGAYFLAGWLAPGVFDAFFRDSMLQNVTNAISSASAASGAEQAQAALGALPGFVANGLGLSAEELAASVAGTTRTVAEVVVDLAAVVVTGIIAVILTILLFILLLIFVRLLAKLINGVFHLPILKQINSLLGAVMGLLSGGVVVVLLCVALNMLLSVYGNGFWGIQQKDVENSIICSFVAQHSPVPMIGNEKSNPV